MKRIIALALLVGTALAASVPVSIVTAGKAEARLIGGRGDDDQRGRP